MADLRVPEKRSAGGMPQYRQQIQTVTPGAGAGARLSDSAGSIAAQGAQAGLQGVINTGKAIQGAAKVGFDLYAEYNRTKAMEAYNSFQESMQNDLYGENGIFNRKGENALSSVTDAEKIMRERAGEFEKNLGDMGKVFFQKQVGTYGRQLLPQVQRHATSEFNSWRVNTAKTRAELAKNAALENMGDPEVFNQQVKESGLAIMEIARLNGWSQEQTELATKENASGIYLAAGSSALSKDDVKQAQSILASGMLAGEDKIRLETAIKIKQDQLEAKARAEAERARVQAEKARNIRLAEYSYSLLENPDFQKDPGLAIEAIRSSGLPIEERFKVERAFSESWNMQRLNDERTKEFSLNQRIEKGKAELRAAETKSQRDYILAQADPDAKPALLREATNLAQGFETPSDPVKFVQAKSEAGERNVSIETLSNKYGAYLTNADMATVLSIYDDKSLARQQKEITRAFDVYAPMTGMDFVGAEGAARKAALKVTFANLCEERDARTQQDVEAVAYEFFSDRTKPGRLWDSTYSAQEAGEIRAETGEVLPIQVPDAVRKFIKQEYALKGQPEPTEDVIREAYRKNFGAFRGAIYE